MTPEPESYTIRGSLQGGKGVVVDEAERYWESCPEYRGARLSEAGVFWRGGGTGWTVVAVFPKGEDPELLRIVWEEDDDVHLEVALGAERTLREWEERASLNKGEAHRLVFHHRDEAMAEYFCRCVETFRWGVWAAAEPGDGRAEAQWSEVFGGDSQ